jgi:chromosome partitioning protein
VRTVSIINQKGGCGKTTSAINLAGICARRGLRTLLVDLDPQSHCAAGLAIPEGRIDLDIGDALGAEGPIDPMRLLWRVSRNLDLAPSRMRLAGLEAMRGGLAEKPDRERRLAAVLRRLAPSYDICFVDCSPAIGLLTYNALAAADDVLIPVETSFFALQGATKQVNTIRSLAKRLGSAASYWLVATIHDDDSALARDLLDELRRRFARRVAPVVVRRDLTLKEAASFGQPVVEYAPDSTGARDYAALTDWLLTVEPAAPVTGLEGDDPAADEPVPPAPRSVPGVTVTESKLGVPPEPVEPLIPTIVIAEPPAPSMFPVPPPPSVAIGAFAAPAQVATAPTRADDLARIARVVQLRRADERLREVAALHAPRTRLRVEVPQPIEMPPPPRPVGHLLGARPTRLGTLFVQPLSVGRSVAVAGEFNGWSPAAHPMTRNESVGVFEACIPLPAGRHRYRLVVDGRWSADPFNDTSEPNPFGDLNSVVDVPQRAAGGAGAD